MERKITIRLTEEQYKYIKKYKKNHKNKTISEVIRNIILDSKFNAEHLPFN